MIGWAWLFVIIMSPLAVAEALLARTGVPGDDKGPSGSLTERLRRSDVAYVRLLGKGLFVSLMLCSLTFLGGAHGQGVLDASAHVLPNESATLLLGCGDSCRPCYRRPSTSGDTNRVARGCRFLSPRGCDSLGSIANLSQGLTAIPRGFADAVNGTSAIPPFMGISPGQLFGLVCAGLALPLMAASGLGGALHAGARARATGTQARSAMLGLLVFAMLTTLVGISAQSTGSYFRAQTTTAKVMDLTVYRVIPETASQRAEEDRLFTGVLRILEGELRDRGPVFATDTGRVELGHFSVDGEPADVALRFQDGRLISMLRPQEQGPSTRSVISGVPNPYRRNAQRRYGSLALGPRSWSRQWTRIKVSLTGLLLLLVAGAGAWEWYPRDPHQDFSSSPPHRTRHRPRCLSRPTTSESLLPWLHGAGLSAPDLSRFSQA